MKRATWITLVDILAFVTMLLVIATGFLLRYELPHGSGSLGHGEGRGGGNRPVSLIWGMTRQEWGSWHYWLALGLLAVMAAHLFIHWRWIVVSFKGREPRDTRLQALLGMAAAVGLLLLALAPFFSPHQQKTRSELRSEREGVAPPSTPIPSAPEPPATPAPETRQRRRGWDGSR